MPLKDLLQQVIQGSSYQRPDVLTDKAKRLARRAYVSPTPSRLQTNVRNLAPVQQQAILRPQAPKLKVNQFNRALNTGPGRLGLGVLKGMDELNPVRGALPGLAAASDASVNDQSLQNSLLFQGGKLGTQLAGNALMYGKAFQAATKLPVVGAKITAGLKGLNAAGGAKALAGKAIGAYAVGDPLIGALRGGSTALGQRQNVLAGAGKGVIEELTFPAQAAINIPTALKVMGSKDATPMEKVQAGLGAGLSVLALLPIMPGLSDTKMAKVIPDRYKKHMDILRLADQKLKAAVPEKYYNRMSESAHKNPVEFIRNLNDTASIKGAIDDLIGKGKVTAKDAIELYQLMDQDISKIEGITAPSGRFENNIKELRAKATTLASSPANLTTPKEYNRHLKNAYKVATNQKGVAQVAHLKGLVGGDTPESVMLRHEAFREILAKHRDMPNDEFNTALRFIKTLNFPENIKHLSHENRINLLRRYDDYLNTVGIKPVVEDGATYVNTSFVTHGDVKKGKLLSGSRPVLPSPQGVDSRKFSTSTEAGSIIPQNAAKTDYNELLGKKIKLQNELKKVPDTYDNTNRIMRLKSDLAEVEIGMSNIRDRAAQNSRAKKTFGVKAQPNVPPELEPLAKEAAKYDSAEEFVNSKINAFHQTNAKFDKFQDAETTYFRTDKLKTSTYGKETVEAFVNTKKPYDKGDFYLNESEMKELLPRLKSQGYDAIILRGRPDDANAIREIISLDSKNILTKSQLTDLYNQVKGGAIAKEVSPIDKLGSDLNIPPEALPLVGEMRKFNSWEDFKAEADKSEHTPEMEFGSTMVNGTEIPYEAQRALSKWANSMGFKDNEEAFGAIKSVYPKELKKIQVESSGGRGVPPSGANRLNPAVPIPDIRDSRSIIPQNSATGTTPTIYKGLVPETLNAQKTSLPSTSGDSTENRLTRAQSAPQRISQTQDRQGFELDQSVTKSQRVGQSSKESISPISVNKETGRVENRYVTDARARIEEIDAQIANTRAELNAKKEVVATTRGMFSDETVRLINKIKGIAGRGRYAAGDVETLRNSKHARGVNDAVERVQEATGIQGDDEAFEFIKNFPTKRTASDGKITSLLEEKRALQEFISDANKQSGTFVQVRSKTNRAAERAINDFREWETQVFKQEGAITRKRLDKQLAGEIASMVRQNTKPAYLKNVEQLKDISNVGKGMTDVYRNVEHVFGKDSQVKREMLDPLDISRATLVDDLDLWGNKLQAEIVDSLGIKPNTKESAAVQQYGEKLRDYDSLVKEFGEKKAQNIKDADRWFRKQYDTLLSEVNAARSKIYPNNPKRLIPRRSDYYRHFRDLSDTFAGLKNLFESSAGIDPSLSGVSEYVKPKSKWLSFAQQRLGMKTKYDAVGGFVDYVNAQSYAKHIDPHINKFRILREELVNATSDRTRPGYGKLNNFIEFLDDYANDLAGKTNPADRALQKYIGRNPYRVLNWVNSRTKLNVILGNLSSAVAQFFNIPQGLAEAGPVNSARGGIRTLSSILSDDKAMAKSLFLKARYADDLATRFDTSIIGDAKRAAAWITSIGDEVGTRFIWNSLYEKGLKEGVDNPVKYADDLTRKMVAGRGIGEVPLLQKSKTFQLIAPFQLEVGNVWHVMREWAGEKAANKFVTFFVASYVMNRMAKNLRGSDVSFDPINAMIEAANTLEEEENTGRGAFMAAGRLLGEILSNAPLGQSIASIYPEYGAQIGDTRLPTRGDFFGEGDPTRFGSGPLFVRGVTDPLAVVPPFGGQQLKRTYQGIQSWARGYDESASGKIRMPIEQSPINLIKSATFGKYSTKDARDYFNNDRSVLGEKQSETYKRIYKTQGPEAAKRYYDSIISKREGGGASGAFEGASGNAFSGGVIATGLQGTPKTKKGRAGRRPSLKSTPRLVITRPKAAPKFRVTRKPVSKVSGVSTKGLPKFRIVRA